MMKNLLPFFCFVITYTICKGQNTEFAHTSLAFKTNLNVIAPAPEACFTTDLDNDGDIDVIVANGNFNSGFSVLLNLGNGAFDNPVQYTTGFECWDIVAADFTGDTIPDIAVTNRGTGNNYNGNSISVFPGNGNGTFGSKTNYTTGNGPIGIATADFNLDGFMDIAVANNGGFGTGSTVSVLMNNAGNGFLPVTTVTNIPKPYKLKTGNLDGDNLPDIVVADEEEKITVLHNTGSGFTAAHYTMQLIQYNNLYASVQLADVDNDNDLDVFYSSLGTQEVSLRRNIGNGVLDSIEMILLDANIYGGTADFKVTDLNNDGFNDIAAVTSIATAGGGYRIAMNNGNGLFTQGQKGSAGEATFGIMTGDVDNDGDNDLMTIDNYSNALTVHANDGSGSFPAALLYAAGFPIIVTKIESGDVDNDGDLDVVTSADSRTAINTPVSYSLNNGNGTFTTAVTISAPLGGVGVKLRDINGDGYHDIIYASGINTAPYDFFTALNNGNGTFASPVRWNMNSCGWNDLEAADIDNDGDIDVVISEWLGCPSVPFSGQRIFISYNNGAGNFSAPTIQVLNVPVGPLALCDFNEDGFIDVATGESASIGIFMNDGTGHFTVPGNTVSMAQSPFDILATDLNNDGHTDITSCNYGSNPGDYSLTVRMGNGNGTFQALQLLDAAYSPDLANVSGVAAGDVDNDGDLDLMVGQNATHDMGIYTNDGNGNFNFKHRLCVYYNFCSPWFGDFDGDGLGDVAGMISLPPSGLQSALTVLPGITTGSATGGAGLSACSTTATGVNENNTSAATLLSIEPNPFSETAYVKFTMNHAGICELIIFDTKGQKVYGEIIELNGGVQSLSLKRNTLAKGVYHLQLKTVDIILSKAFVIY